MIIIIMSSMIIIIRSTIINGILSYTVLKFYDIDNNYNDEGGHGYNQDYC